METVIAAPSVRARAREKGIDLAALAQKLGRRTLTTEDLNDDTMPAHHRDSARYWAQDHSAWGPVSHEETSRFARLAAANLSAANAEIPQVTHHDLAPVSALETFRHSLRDEARQRGIKLTALAFHIKGLALTLRQFPQFNAALSPDGCTLIKRDYVHIGMAVDTEHGLMVPVIRDADHKGLWQLAEDIADLASRARARKIAPEEMGGASMTISSLGATGGIGFTPIVNPPELAILGLSRVDIHPLWDSAREQFLPTPMIPLDLSYDHRVINGSDASRFVTRLVSLLSDPRHMMI